MSLKGDRYEFMTDISNFANSVMTRGGVVCSSTVGSGAALDQSAALVAYAASTSGAFPVGILMNDMVNLDLTRIHPNFLRDEVQMGGKVTVLKKGWVVTDMIVGTPANGDFAVLSSSGYMQPLTRANFAAGALNTAVNPIVGKFLSSKDEDGFAKVSPDL